MNGAGPGARIENRGRRADGTDGAHNGTDGTKGSVTV